MSQSGDVLACIGRAWGDAVVDRLADEYPVDRWHDPDCWPVHLSRYRYVFLLHWSWVVPQAVIGASELVNFHCTALPYGRGGGPIENLLLRGHTDTVITAHRVTEELDAGPIYGTRGPVSLAGTKEEILSRFIHPVTDLMQWILDSEPTPEPQRGEVVRFRRLPRSAYQAFWDARRRGHVVPR